MAHTLMIVETFSGGLKVTLSWKVVLPSSFLYLQQKVMTTTRAKVKMVIRTIATMKLLTL